MIFGIYLTGFVLGTFKFLFSHWSIYLIANESDELLNFLELFIPTTLGALITMVICYYTSEKLMNRAVKKQNERIQKAIAEGKVPKIKKKFTYTNKLIVQIKMKLGIYGITLLAPLFLSIPIGSIVCAKFYRHQKKTFPLMVLVVTGYSTLMSGIIVIFAQ